MLGRTGSLLSMALASGPMVGAVLLLLAACSIGCWTIILYKHGVIRRASRENRAFLKIFWASPSFQIVEERSEELPESPLAEIFRSGYGEWRRCRTAGKEQPPKTAGRAKRAERAAESVRRTLHQAAASEKARLFGLLTHLATIASAAPFVGLFGTVWGIMESFRNIGATGSANLAVVAPGISEALIATAAGLAAAIPAVIAYNYFANAIREMSTEMDGFAAQVLNIVVRSRELSGSPERGEAAL